jgi:predicted DsbA family dithiol-disulfide isomerase
MFLQTLFVDGVLLDIRNLNNALKKFSNIKFDIRHIPFQLNPDMPAEGISRENILK